MAYLDWAGAGRVSERQMNLVASDLHSLNIANPHSRHASGRAAQELIESARIRVLNYFGTSPQDYTVIFTSGATDSLRIIADCFDFGSMNDEGSSTCTGSMDQGSSMCTFETDVKCCTDRAFAYLMDSHTSIVGMRETVKNRCLSINCWTIDQLNTALKMKINPSERLKTSSLFVLTAMSNFCGRKYPLIDLVERIQHCSIGGGHWRVCLDASAWVSSCGLDLSRVRADFVVLSFYKMFGYPTGLGALIVKNESAHLLKKRFFGGGTVDLVLHRASFLQRRSRLTQRFEDGTVNFYAIAALSRGFEEINACGGIDKIEQDVHRLAKRAFDFLHSSRHKNGTPIAIIYNGSEGKEFGSIERQGPIVNFNLLREDGSVIGYVEVEKMSELYGIELRTGCFCNQGACQLYLDISDRLLIENYQSGKTCGDTVDLVNGRPVGSVRISFGKGSTGKDVELFEQMIECCFIHSDGHQLSSVINETKNKLTESRLSEMFIYPIKSCRALKVSESVILSSGLSMDRRWMIVDGDGRVVTQRRNERLCHIQCQLFNNDEMQLNYYDENIRIPINTQQTDNGHRLDCRGEWTKTIDCGDEVAEWLNEMLLSNGYRLVQAMQEHNETTMKKSLSNEAPYLLINRNSIRALAVAAHLSLNDALSRFRANLIIDDVEAFTEDNARMIIIGGHRFEVVGKCTRCQMICIDQETGEKSAQTLLALRDLRIGSKITFGVYLKYSNNETIDSSPSSSPSPSSPSSSSSPSLCIIRIGDRVHLE